MNETIIDSNEPENIKNAVRAELEKRGFQAHTGPLDQGDFHYPSKDVVIERKTGSDLAQSIQDRRISRQADRMIAEHDHVYLVIEGDPYNLEHTDLHHNSIRGQLISLAAKRNIKIIPTNNPGGTAYTVARLFERYENNDHKQNTEYLKTHDTGEVQDVQTAMLMQIDGVSEQKARKISETVFKNSITNAFADTISVENKLQEIDGIGEITTQKIIKAFTQKQ